MPIKNRLLASALIPVMAGCFAGYTAKAASLPVTFEVAQAQPLSPEEEMLLKRKQKDAVGEANDGAAGQRPPKQDAEPAARPQREAAPQQGTDEPPPPKRQRPAAEPAQDAEPAPRPRREAAPQPGNEAPPPPKRQQPAAEPAQDAAPPAAKPQREAAPQPGNDAPPPPKRQQPAAEPAQDAAPPAAKPPREAAPQPGNDAPPPPKRQQPAAEPAQDAAPPAAKPPREAAPQPGNDAPPPPKRQQPAAEPAQDAAPPAAKPQREAAPQPGNDAPPPPKRQQPAAEPAQDAAPPAAKPQHEAAPQPGNDAPPPPKRQQPAAEPAQDAAPPAAKPPREAAPQPGNDAPPPPRTEAPQPGQPPQGGAQAQPQPRPVPPIEDRRTERERKAEAADPSKTDDTVVLPVDNGAAVLDSDKDADNRGGQSARDERRRERERQRDQVGNNDVPPPRDDAEAQRRAPQVRQADIDAGRREQGRRRDQAPDFLGAILGPLLQNGQNAGGYDAPRRFDDRTVYETDDGIVVRSDERRRLGRDADETYYEDLARGRVRETIVRQDGGRIVTIYNRYGDVIQRSRFTRDGREFLLVYAPEADQEQRPPVFRDPGDDLPPMRLRIPVRDYIIDTSSDPNRDYYDFLAEPPVEPVERVYTIDEVKYSARLRDKVRRIDLDTVTFATGSADVPMTQAKTVRSVAEAMQKVLARDPGETFLIEGHTDAVGSDESNLVLSDRRAESVANLLTDVYGIPPENLTTQGYGERYLKVRTEAAEQQNRRVTIRRVTSLVRPATAGK